VSAAGVTAAVLRGSLPFGLMSALQIVVLVLVLSGYGLTLAMLFFVFQAPDVTLSELCVGAVALPVLLLLTLGKVKKEEE
jgi:energy-converting hydrogenase B subunit D